MMTETRVLLTLARAKGNLDLFCANHAHSITEHTIAAYKQAKKDKPAEKAENLITQALGVLQGQGIYATFLLLAAKTKKPSDASTSTVVPEKELQAHLIVMLNAMELAAPITVDNILDTLRGETGLLSNLSTLLLVKRTMERALTYARYHAKAQGGE